MASSRTVVINGTTFYIEERGLLQDSEGSGKPPADIPPDRANDKMIVSPTWTDNGFLYLIGGPTTCQMWFDAEPDAAMLTRISDYWDAPELVARQETDAESYAALGTDAERIAYIAGISGLT